MKYRSLLPAFLIVITATLAAALPAQAQNGTVATLHTFTDSEGSTINPPAIGPDGNLYTTARHGGENGLGSVIMMTPAGTVTVLHSIDGNTEGQYPTGLVLGADGALYGAASAYENPGIIYKITTDGVFTILYHFPADVDPSYSPLVRATDGTLYGSTQGAVGNRTLYSVSPDGAVATVHTFTAQEMDAYSYDCELVAGQDGNVYGMTEPDSPHGSGDTTAVQYGLFFSISPAGDFTPLHTFSGGSEDGATGVFTGLSQGSDGNFFFVATSSPGYLDGNVTQISPDGTVLILHAFDSSEFAFEHVPLIVAGDGNFYGATTDAIRLSADGLTFTTLASVPGGSSGSDNVLVPAGDGSFYGATDQTIYRAVLYSSMKPVVTANLADATINENSGGKATVVLKRSGDDLSSALTVRIVLRGTAVNGSDYAAVSNMVTFAAGSAKAKVKIFPVDLGIQGGSKTVIVKLKDATDGSYTLGTPSKVTVTIEDND